MNGTLLVVALLVLSAVAFQLGRTKALRATGGKIAPLHSLPTYYGSYVAVWVGVPSLIVVVLWLIFGPQITNALLITALPEEVLASLTPADGPDP